jgi:hypothetical protein
MFRFTDSATTFHCSRHAAQRQQQRGFKTADIELLMAWGEDVEDGLVMSDRALKHARYELARRGAKAALQRLDHIRGMTLIEQDRTFLTLFRADRKRLQRLREGHVVAKRAG